MYKDLVYPYIEHCENSLAIDLETIKIYLKLSPTVQDNNLDNELSLMCQTALEYAEKYSRQIFVSRTITTNRVFWGEFRNGEVQNYFTLRRTPIKSVISIKYDDDKVLPATEYKVVNRRGNYDIINLINAGNLPEVKNDWFPIEITYVAGYTTIPNDIKQAMLYHIASMWLNRGDYDNNNLKCPQMARDIYKKYKIIEVGS